MADRIEREIEEILAKLDDLPPAAQQPPERRPISVMERRDQPRRPATPPRPLRTSRSIAPRLTPTTLLLAGAVTVILGLILSNVWGPLIWAAFAGVVVFLGAFVAAFMRAPRGSGEAGAEPRGRFWRDRYIEYTPQGRGVAGRVKRWFRR